MGFLFTCLFIFVVQGFTGKGLGGNLMIKSMSSLIWNERRPDLTAAFRLPLTVAAVQMQFAFLLCERTKKK